MFSHDYFTVKSFKKTSVHSLTSSESLKESRVPDRDSKQFALSQFSSSKENAKLHNVECTVSGVGDCDLEDIRRRYRIPNSVKLFAPKTGQTADNPPKDCFAVYNVMVENGLRLPANDFVNDILGAVGQVPAQISFNSWAILTAFQVACHVAGVKTSVELFEHMYKISTFKKTYFSQKDNKNLTLLNLPNKRQLDFFFVSANAFGEKVPRRFCVKTDNFKRNQRDIEFQFLEFSKKFPRRLLYNAYLDEKVLLVCNIYKDTNKRPREDAYDLLLKANDASVQIAIAKNNQCVLKLIEDENLRSGILADVEASDASEFPDGSSTSKIRRTSDGASENMPATSVAGFPVVSSNSVKIEKGSTLDASPQLAVPSSTKKFSRMPLVKEFASEVSHVKDQYELDSISVQLDDILKKGTQSLQVTSNNRIQICSVLASMEYCHLGSSLEKAACQVSNLREQVELLHSRHAKLERCLESYNEQVSDCKNNIVVLNAVRARLDTFGLMESPQEVSRIEVQVEQLDSIAAQLDASLVRSAQVKASLEKSEQQVSAMEDQVERLIGQNRRFDDASLEIFSQQDSQLQLESLTTQFESSLNEFNQLEESLNKSSQNVCDLINQVGQLTSILAQLVVDVEQANNDFKVSSDSTKNLYRKARRGEKPQDDVKHNSSYVSSK